jgi:hypothetical protein
LRAANARHQRSDPGRLDHNRHQQDYRDRRRARRAHPTYPVTYHTSPDGDSASSCGHDIPPCPLPVPAPAPATSTSGAAPILRGPTWRCRFCRRPGIPLLWLLCWRLRYAARRWNTP